MNLKPASARFGKLVGGFGFRWIRTISIRYRLIGAFSLVCIVPLLFVAFFTYKTSSQSIREKIVSNSGKLNEQLAINLRGEMRNIELITNDIMFDLEIQKDLVYYDSLSDFDKLEFVMKMNQMLRKKEYIKGVNILYKVLPEGKDVGIGRANIDESEIKRLEALAGDSQSALWDYTGNGTGDLLVYQNLYSIIYNKKICTMIIQVNSKLLDGVLANAEIAGVTGVYVVDGNGIVISDSNKISGFDKIDMQKLQVGKSYISGNINILGKEYVAILTDIPETQWKVLYAVNRGYIESEGNRILSITAVSTGVCIIVFIIFALFISLSISTPLIHLVKNMNLVESGKMDTEVIDNGKDEIGMVIANYNNMVKSLKTVKKDLETKNEELERFTYTVSHDLKSPLITIKGFAGIIEADINNERYDRIKSDFKRIGNAADKMQELLDGLLVLSRIGRIINPSEEFSMYLLTVDVLELLDGGIKAKGIQVSVDEKMPVIYADINRIREVLQNLIENAIKFIDKPDGKIEIGCCSINNEEVFFVKDNGSGIDAKYFTKIFGLFDKLNNTKEGCGIGLAIVKRIIDYHGGRIWVESTLGDGAAFFFSIGNKQLLRDEN